MKTVLFDRLDAFRKEGDAIADQVVAQIFESGDRETIRNVLTKSFSNSDILPEALPQQVQQYFDEQGKLPEWANIPQLKHAQAFFARHAQPIMGMLGSCSLPYCYAAADGAQVLYFSERIRKDTFQRLLETGQFVFDVMENGAFEPQGKGIRSALKVRLIHATIRYHLIRSGKWNMAWGLPVNQEDMAGTNLAFSLIVLRGLRKSGFQVSAEDFQAYLHYWNVVGHLLGLAHELMPENGKEAFHLAKNIETRHFKPSIAGQELTKALLKSFQAYAPAMPEGYTASYMRYLMGDEVADILGLPPSNWTLALIQQLKFANVFSEAIQGFVKNRQQPDESLAQAKKMALGQSKGPIVLGLPGQLPLNS
jgi:hypothetical protein